MNNAMLSPEGFTRPTEAARFASVTLPTIWRWAREGRFPKPVRLSPGVSGIRNSDLLEWAADPAEWFARHATKDTDKQGEIK